MIEHETDINVLNPETGTSPTMLASALGYLNICNMLIDAGAEINASDHSGNTPLHLAAQGFGEQIAVVKALLDHGADINATNDDGFTPAMLAKRMENEACFKVLDSYVHERIEPPTYQEFEGAKEEKIQTKIESKIEENMLSFA